MKVLTCPLPRNHFVNIFRPFPIAVEFLNMIGHPFFQLIFLSVFGFHIENAVDTFWF
ncbi:MAG: hypothetical protein QF551_08365 [Candidatus Marinimicrobia bacterium]|nr:hypothetical protein [Candidatus Neomarinimicrobiota bacterium]